MCAVDELGSRELKDRTPDVLGGSVTPCDDEECNMLSLPEAVVGEVMEHLGLKEQRYLLGTSQYLWSLRLELDPKTKEICLCEQDVVVLPRPNDVEGSLISRQLFFGRFQSLHRLDLGTFATDNFLVFIAKNDLLQSLREIAMVKSEDVTDLGLWYLSLGEARAENLESIDITYCRNTTYSGTLPLRENLKNLRLIRRQPEWMDGHFHTPFGSSTRENVLEVHTYWPDGSFSFDREVQSSGFVCDLFEWGRSDFVGDKLQYNDFVPPAGWPSWTRYCYRPGVSLRRLPDDIQDGESIRSVLVSQRVRGLRPPNEFSVMDGTESVVPMGETRYFDRSGNLLAQDAPEDEQYTMVSRMQLFPLPKDGLMPPEDVVQRNFELCERLKPRRSADNFDELEDMLHSILMW